MRGEQLPLVPGPDSDAVVSRGGASWTPLGGRRETAFARLRTVPRPCSSTQWGRGWPNRTAGFPTSAAIHRIVSPPWRAASRAATSARTPQAQASTSSGCSIVTVMSRWPRRLSCSVVPRSRSTPSLSTRPRTRMADLASSIVSLYVQSLSASVSGQGLRWRIALPRCQQSGVHERLRHGRPRRLHPIPASCISRSRRSRRSASSVPPARSRTCAHRPCRPGWTSTRGPRPRPVVHQLGCLARQPQEKDLLTAAQGALQPPLSLVWSSRRTLEPSFHSLACQRGGARAASIRRSSSRCSALSRPRSCSP
jgi:hypothetical protein